MFPSQPLPPFAKTDEPVVHFRSTIPLRPGRSYGRDCPHPRHPATSGEIIIESEIKGLSLLCPWSHRWRHEKSPRECGERDPVFTDFASPSLPTPWPAYVSCTGVNRQPNLDVSSTRRGCPFRFSFGRSWPSIYIALRDQLLTRRESSPSETGRPTGPLASRPLHSVSPCTKWVQVRSKVIRVGKVVSFFGDANCTG